MIHAIKTYAAIAHWLLKRLFVWDKDAGNVFELWDKIVITDYIYDMQEMCHIEATQNAFDEIDRMLNKFKKSENFS